MFLRGSTRHLEKLKSIIPFKIVKKIHAGAQAALYKARHKKTDLTVAIKIYNFKTNKHRADEFQREVDALKKAVGIPGVLRYYDSQTTDTNGILITEWCTGGSLASLASDMKLHHVEDLAAFLFRTLSALHYKKICHGDIKPENILLRNTPFHGELFCLCDFGLCRTTEPIISNITGTPDFIAPELLNKKQQLTDSKIDTWMVGILLYECATGETPFYDVDIQTTFDKIQTLEPKFTHEAFQSVDGLTDFLRFHALVKNPNQRKKIEDLADHPFIVRVLHPPCLPLAARCVSPRSKHPSPFLSSGSIIVSHASKNSPRKDSQNLEPMKKSDEKMKNKKDADQEVDGSLLETVHTKKEEEKTCV